MSKNSKQTSKSVSSLASEVLRNPSSSAIQKELAGSALSQSHSNKQTEIIHIRIRQKQCWDHTKNITPGPLLNFYLSLFD
jgi:hypothetical protein